MGDINELDKSWYPQHNMIGVLKVDDLDGEYLLAIVYRIIECDP